MDKKLLQDESINPFFLKSILARDEKNNRSSTSILPTLNQNINQLIKTIKFVRSFEKLIKDEKKFRVLYINLSFFF